MHFVFYFNLRCIYISDILFLHMLNILKYLLHSLKHLRVEKVLFSSKIFEMDIFTDLQVLRSPESQCDNFSNSSVYCVFVRVCVSAYVCYHDKSKANYNGILHLYDIQILLETLYEYQINNLCTRTHKMF